jgi:pyruvate/2-oxoacid:ferredoxin oxidoreductase beta subunit
MDKGKIARKDISVVAIGGDGGTKRYRSAALSGAMERDTISRTSASTTKRT